MPACTSASSCGTSHCREQPAVGQTRRGRPALMVKRRMAMRGCGRHAAAPRPAEHHDDARAVRRLQRDHRRLLVEACLGHAHRQRQPASGRRADPRPSPTAGRRATLRPSAYDTHVTAVRVDIDLLDLGVVHVRLERPGADRFGVGQPRAARARCARRGDRRRAAGATG